MCGRQQTGLNPSWSACFCLWLFQNRIPALIHFSWDVRSFGSSLQASLATRIFKRATCSFDRAFCTITTVLFWVCWDPVCLDFVGGREGSGVCWAGPSKGVGPTAAPPCPPLWPAGGDVHRSRIECFLIQSFVDSSWTFSLRIIFFTMSAGNMMKKRRHASGSEPDRNGIKRLKTVNQDKGTNCSLFTCGAQAQETPERFHDEAMVNFKDRTWLCCTWGPHKV